MSVRSSNCIAKLMLSFFQSIGIQCLQYQVFCVCDKFSYKGMPHIFLQAASLKTEWHTTITEGIINSSPIVNGDLHWQCDVPGDSLNILSFVIIAVVLYFLERPLHLATIGKTSTNFPLTLGVCLKVLNHIAKFAQNYKSHNEHILE